MIGTSICRAGKENEISIRIHNDEGPGAPGLLLECLMKVHSRSLATQKELFDLICSSYGERSGKQMLALPDIANEYGFVHHPQSKPGLVACYLPVEWRIAIDEIDREAELMGIEITGCLDVGNKQLCGD